MSSLVADYSSHSESEEEFDHDAKKQGNEKDCSTEDKRNIHKDNQAFVFFQTAADDSSDEEPCKKEEKDTEGDVNKSVIYPTLPSAHGLLPSAKLESGESSKSSVFFNPFKQAEEAKTLVLEKHVKLAPKLEDVREINGKKVCWNFRKGRCRFGSYCKYAHDSDLLQEPPGYKKPIPTYDEAAVISSHTDVNGSNRSTSKRPVHWEAEEPSRKVVRHHNGKDRTEASRLLKS